MHLLTFRGQSQESQWSTELWDLEDGIWRKGSHSLFLNLLGRPEEPGQDTGLTCPNKSDLGLSTFPVMPLAQPQRSEEELATQAPGPPVLDLSGV